MKSVAGTILVFVASFLVFSGYALAGEPPQPEQGLAVGTIVLKCQRPFTTTLIDEEVSITIEFWNVGKMGKGQDYSGMLVKMVPPAKDFKDICLVGSGSAAFFDGGPNGAIDTGTGDYLRMRMVNGSHIEFTVNQNFEYSVPTGQGSLNRSARYTGTVVANLPIQNPEVFSKYDWNGEVPAEKSALEDSGVAIRGVSRNVQVNVPNPDGTYDEENWKWAVDLDDGIGSLPVGTHIRTWAAGWANLSFDDGTVFKMQPKSEIILLSAAAKQNRIKLLPGAYQANIRKAQDPDYEIDMDQAIVVVKGTTLVLEETGDTSIVKVIEGSVSFRSKTSGKSESVDPGETVTADSSGLGPKTTFDVKAENDSWNGLPDAAGTPAPTRNYLYYVGAAALLALAAVTFLIIKRKKA